MTDEGAIIRRGEVCPHLGLAEDPTVRYLGVSRSHRCLSGSSPDPIGAREQASYCLPGTYRLCPRLQVADEQREPEEDSLPFGWDWVESRGGVGAIVLQLLTGLAWPVLAVAAVILLAPLLDTVDSVARTRGAPTSAPSETERVAPPATAPNPSDEGVAPAVSALGSTPSPVPSPAATAVPIAPKPTSTPTTAGGTYVVKPKDTLWSVARAHGVTVDDLVKANGLKDKNVLRAGQKLTIPQPQGRP